MNKGKELITFKLKTTIDKITGTNNNVMYIFYNGYNITSSLIHNSITKSEI